MHKIPLYLRNFFFLDHDQYDDLEKDEKEKKRKEKQGIFSENRKPEMKIFCIFEFLFSIEVQKRFFELNFSFNLLVVDRWVSLSLKYFSKLKIYFSDITKFH